MNTGVVQIMWKEIGIGCLMLYVFRNMLDIYMIKKYKKITKLYGIVEADQLKLKIEKHLKLCNLFSVGPWNKNIYFIYNGLCWMMSSINLVEGKELEFLKYLEKVKKENEFEMKPFALFLFYRSKKNVEKAKYYYNAYLKCKHVDNDIAIIMRDIVNEGKKSEIFNESIKKFIDPALQKLFKENKILECGEKATVFYDTICKAK